MFLSFFYILIIKICSKPSYYRSMFGRPGTDEVENEYIDGIEILERGLTHPPLKPVSEGKYTSEPIDPNDYPWPGHELRGSCTRERMIEEANEIEKRYRRTNLTQNEIHWHPAAAKQFYTTDEEISSADRVKIKYTMQPKYERHLVPAFAPPGEVIKVEIPEAFVGKLSMVFNVQCRSMGDTDHCKTRLYALILNDLRLDRKVNYVGLPYGGDISFYYSGNDPLEINISGVILQPYFYYGMTSDDEWENDLSKRPGPIAYLDTGNLVHIVPSKFIRGTTRMNDCMKYWRSAIQISQTTARDVSGYNNPRYGRILNPVMLKYDTYVSAGAAVAMVGGNFVHFPCDWISSSVIWDSSIDNPWGTVHEIDHHHQENWAKTQDAGEMSNNAINLAIFSKMNLVSSYRPTSGWGRYSYASFMLNNRDSYGLQRYSTLLHLFGLDKFKEFVKADQEVKWYSRDEYGNAGSEMLRASRIYNRNMRHHWNFYTDVTNDTILGQNTLNELNNLNLEDFHPVASIYGVGYVVDGVAFRTARAYRILPFPQTIDFVSSIVQRDETDKFGNFEFKSAKFESGRESAWVQQSTGVYTLTPKESLIEEEEVNVTYVDRTTNKEHIVICQFTQKYSNTISYFTQYAIPSENNNNLINGYRYVVEHPNDVTIINSGYRNDGIFFSDYENSSTLWISIEEGKFTPDDDGNYQFSLTADTESAFYLSEEPLKGNPDLDYDKMINYQQGTQMSFANGNKSAIFNLSSEKIYYFRFIVFPSTWGNHKGRGWCGFKRNNEGNWETVPAKWFKFKDLDPQIFWDNQFAPTFERMYLMDVWDGINLIKNDQSKWNLYKVPRGETRINTNDFQGNESPSLSPTKSITDGDPTTEYRVHWWSGQGVENFPHIFEIDMGETNQFKALKIGGSGNPNLYGMNNFIRVYLAPNNYSSSVAGYQKSNYSINHEESLIWEGIHNPQVSDIIEFDNIQSGRYLKIVSINNTLTWKDNWAGRTSISSIEVGYKVHSKKIYPITNTKYFEFKYRWDETRAGCYYNGKGFTGYGKGAAPTSDSNSKNSKLKIKVPAGKKEIGIIGDYYPGMGAAVVRLDGEIVDTIRQSIDVMGDLRRLTKASRSYKTLLYYNTNLDESKPHTITVEVIKGKITIAGILTQQMIVDYFNDNGTYENILKDEFKVQPGEYDWIEVPDEPLPPQTPTTVNPIPNEIQDFPTNNVKESTSNSIVVTDNGFKSKEEEVSEMVETVVDKESTTFKTVSLQSKEVTISESGNYQSSVPLYFFPSQEGSTITIDQGLRNSNIGVTSYNSPIVKLNKEDSPITLYNNQTKGSLTVDLPSHVQGEVRFKEASSNKGDFTIYVPSSITKLVLNTLSLFKESGFEVKAIDNQASAKLLQDNVDPNQVRVKINNLLNVASNSKSTLLNAEIAGTLVAYDDSLLTLDRNSDFSKTSQVKMIIKSSKKYESNEKPRIYVKDLLSSIPSLIVVTPQSGSNLTDFENLPLIGSDVFPDCEKLISRTTVQFNDGIQRNISPVCKENNGITCLALSVNEVIDQDITSSNPDEKDKGNNKKSKAGLIAGVVIAVIVVIAAAVVGVFFFIRYKKSRTHDSSDVLMLAL